MNHSHKTKPTKPAQHHKKSRGGILVGLIEIFVKLFAPGWYEAVTYGTLIVILLVKPSGILGKNVGEKV